MRIGNQQLSCNRFTSEDYAFYAIGSLEGPEREVLQSHLREHCPKCTQELKQALEFWYLFAAMTERLQARPFPEASAELRERVVGIPHSRPQQAARTKLRTWLQIAAGIMLVAGASGVSWNIERIRMNRNVAAAQVRIDQQTSAVKKLESENSALKNLLVAARNAPPVFPGKDNIVSVQDPYTLRDLQQARQTQVAVSQALTDERTKSSELEKRLTQTTSLLAAATKDREEADRQSRKAFDAAKLEKERGASELSSELSAYKSKIQDLESQISRYKAMIDSQTKGMERHFQMISLLQSPNVSLVQLRPTEAGKTSSGVAVIADNARLAFFPTNLPSVRAGRTYQLWLIRDKGPAIVSAGTFSGTAKDAPALQFDNKELLTGIRGLAVTEEPAGGSPAPTGHKFLIGTPKT
jgi:hypothetical protein